MDKLIDTIKMFVWSPLGVLALIILFLWYNNYDLKQNSIDFVQKEYYGMVTEKNIYSKKLGYIYFHNRKTKKQDYYTYAIFGQKHLGIYDYVSLGDSIMKKKGEGRITI